MMGTIGLKIDMSALTDWLERVSALSAADADVHARVSQFLERHVIGINVLSVERCAVRRFDGDAVIRFVPSEDLRALASEIGVPV